MAREVSNSGTTATGRDSCYSALGNQGLKAVRDEARRVTLRIAPAAKIT